METEHPPTSQNPRGDFLDLDLFKVMFETFPCFLNHHLGMMFIFSRWLKQIQVDGRGFMELAKDFELPNSSRVLSTFQFCFEENQNVVVFSQQ